MKKIKTFEDACKTLKLNPAHFPDLSMISEKLRAALTAHFKLIIIAKALNKEWEPDWTNDNEYKWYPWFYMEKGFSYYGADYYFTASDVGSRLCFQTREMAEYAGKQFLELYKEYMTISK